jgi:uncharacterized protein
MKYPKLLVKDTHKYGKGVYTNEDIKKGTIIYTLGGIRMGIDDFIRKVLSGQENIDDPFQIGKRTYIDLNEFSRTFNHSCNPNGGIRNNSELFALRDIKKGEQITYDYSLTIAPTLWKMKCMCGSTDCRKYLGDVLSIPKKRRDQYWKMGAIQRYMKKLLKEADAGVYKQPKYEKRLLEAINSVNHK